MRAGIDTARYPFPGGPREPLHHVVPRQFPAHAESGGARMVRPLRAAADRREAAAGAACWSPVPILRRATPFADPANAIELLGFVDDIQPLFSSCAVFVCPIRSGSGVRVKLLEAFASGIPVVSTPLGAEGLARAMANSARSPTMPPLSPRKPLNCSKIPNLPREWPRARAAKSRPTGIWR